ncbi:MAG: hypothetical protein ACTSYU_00530 [Promethearchaeota archaeon]
MLTWLVDSIDESVSDLKKRMIKHSEQAITENLHDFDDYRKDLSDIIIPLNECKKIKEIGKLEQNIFSITETLKLFSENINDSVYFMAEVMHKAAIEAIEKSTKEFDDFVADIYSIFGTFNTMLQRLKLTNSIRKYIDLVEIYEESLHLLEEHRKLNKLRTNFLIQKGIKEIQLEELNTFGNKRSFDLLQKKKQFISEKLQQVSDKFAQKQEDYNEILDEKEIVDIEKENIQGFFEALSEEILSSQQNATETYNLLYSTLDEIHSSIPYIKVDLRNSTERTISEFIDEFIKGAQVFGKIVSIIDKVSKIEDLNKKKVNVAAIYKKSQEYLKKLSLVIEEIALSVTEANKNAIDESFSTFLQFIDKFKEDFYIIQDSVSLITLSASDQIIRDLLKYSDEQLNLVLDITKNKQDLDYLQEIIGFLGQSSQGIDNDLKIFTHQADRKRRKIINFMLSPSFDSETYEIEHKWNITNSGIVPFANFSFNAKIPTGMEVISLSREAESIISNPHYQIYSWDLFNLEKLANININNILFGFTPSDPDLLYFTNNITHVDAFRFKHVAKAIELHFIECDEKEKRKGKGIIELFNPSTENIIWNIELHIKLNPDTTRDKPLIIKIPYLNPHQKYIQEYSFKIPNKIQPIYFMAMSSVNSGIILERSMESLDEYYIEPYIENTSDFLIHMIDLRVLSTRNLETPYVTVAKKDLENIRPILDFRKRFIAKTLEDPPEVVLDYHSTLHMVYSYQTVTKAKLQKYVPTPELLYSSKDFKKKKSKPMGHLLEKNVIYPDLIMVDEEIHFIDEQIQDIERELQELKIRLSEKQKKRLKVLKNIEKEQIEREKKKKQNEQERKKLSQMKSVDVDSALKDKIISKKKSNAKKQTSKSKKVSSSKIQKNLSDSISKKATTKKTSKKKVKKSTKKKAKKSTKKKVKKSTKKKVKKSTKKKVKKSTKKKVKKSTKKKVKKSTKK